MLSLSNYQSAHGKRLWIRWLVSAARSTSAVPRVASVLRCAKLIPAFQRWCQIKTQKKNGRNTFQLRWTTAPPLNNLFKSSLCLLSETIYHLNFAKSAKWTLCVILPVWQPQPALNQCNDIFCLFSMCKPLVHVVCLHPCIYLYGCAPLLPDWFHIGGPKWAQFLSKWVSPNASALPCRSWKGFFMIKIMCYNTMAATVTRQHANQLNEILYNILLTKAQLWLLFWRVWPLPAARGSVQIDVYTSPSGEQMDLH